MTKESFFALVLYLTIRILAHRQGVNITKQRNDYHLIHSPYALFPVLGHVSLSEAKGLYDNLRDSSQSLS